MHVDKLIPEKVELITATAVDTVARATAEESPLTTERGHEFGIATTPKDYVSEGVVVESCIGIEAIAAGFELCSEEVRDVSSGSRWCGAGSSARGLG